MSKYDALAELLRRKRGLRTQLDLRFAEISIAVPGGVPSSACRHAAWWANETSGSHVHVVTRLVTDLAGRVRTDSER
jgi:hypothetical protein